MKSSPEPAPPTGAPSPDPPTRILVDADACPVKEEVYRVAARHGLEVILVANSWMRTPLRDTVRLVVVEGGLDVADAWIVEHARDGDVVVTNDIPLAAQCLEKSVATISPTGRVFTEEMIGDALATREILSQMREVGLAPGGPAPFTKQDRSRFLQALEEAIRALTR